jgi:hypothetical protein
MQLAWLTSFFENSPAIGLLRSKHAPYVIDFLLGEFKVAGAVVRGMSALTLSLRAYLDNLHESQPSILTDSPENYLVDWCSPKKRYLRRFLDAAHDEPLYELTSATEDVLTFLDELARRDRKFVGTESRLRRIIDTLNDLAMGSSDNVQTRLDHLKDQKAAIERQIADIELAGSVTTYNTTAIRERFDDAISDLISLQGDFRAVEEAFKEITRDVQKRQLTSDLTRGQILGGALDAEEGLKGQDQGVSFDEFARLILSPSKQDHVEDIIKRVAEIEIISSQPDSLKRMRDMVPALTVEARKVLRTYQSLSITLRKLLDRDVRSERQRLTQVLGDLRSMALRLADNPQRDRAVDFSIEAELDIALPTERPFWMPPSDFVNVELKEHFADDQDRVMAFTDLAILRTLDWQGLRQHIKGAVGRHGEISLSQLLDTEEPEYDAVEVLGMIQIAHEDGFQIDHEITETVVVRHGEGSTSRLEIPRVVLGNSASGVAT